MKQSIKLTDHQKSIIDSMFNGSVLKHQSGFGDSWWITKDLGKGFISSKNLLKSTISKLLVQKLIRMKSVDKFNHEYYELTELGESINTKS